MPKMIELTLTTVDGDVIERFRIPEDARDSVKTVLVSGLYRNCGGVVECEMCGNLIPTKDAETVRYPDGSLNMMRCLKCDDE